MTESHFQLQSYSIFSTLCCKSINVLLHMNSIRTNQQISNAFSFTLNALPITNNLLTVSFLLKNIINSTNLFFPSEIIFSNSSISKSATIGFLGYSNAILTNLELILQGIEANSYSIEYTKGSLIIISEEFIEPPSPILLTAQFSNTGSYIIVNFDSPTNKNLNDLTEFYCCNIFNFTSCEVSKCLWLDLSTIKIFPSKSPITNKIINIDNKITLLNFKIKAACTVTQIISNCSNWSYSNSKTISILSPLNPINPNVIISGPNSIGSCLNLQLILTSSTGNGGRPWNKRIFSVTSNNPNITISKLISNYLNDNYIFAPATSIPYNLLVPGFNYVFNIQLCNFLNSCGIGTTTITVLDNIIPSVTILGKSVRTVSINQPLQIVGNAFTVQCDNTISTANLQYIYEIKINNVLQLNMISISYDPTIYYLLPYQLIPNTIYTITLNVINKITATAATSTITVTVSIGQLIAIISGGSKQSIIQSLNSKPLVLDASNSYDEDYNPILGNNLNLKFQWSCQYISPILSNNCPFLLPNLINTPSIKIKYISSNINNIVGLITVVITDNTKRSATTSVTIDII